MTWQEGWSLIQCQNGAFLCGVCRFSPSSSQSPGRHEAKRCGRLTLSGCRPSLQEVLAAHAGSSARTRFDRMLKENVPYAFLVYGKAAQYTTNREKEAKLCSHCKTKNGKKKERLFLFNRAQSWKVRKSQEHGLAVAEDPLWQVLRPVGNTSRHDKVTSQICPVPWLSCVKSLHVTCVPCRGRDGKLWIHHRFMPPMHDRGREESQTCTAAASPSIYAARGIQSLSSTLPALIKKTLWAW